jgi:hypothetical protein
MPKVLTVGSTLVCAHQGTVTLVQSQSLLKVAGNAVLVQGDVDGKTISGCATPVSMTSKPCTTVVSMMLGTATKLKVGGKAVLLETAMGMTDGVTPAPTNIWRVQAAGQQKLDAI